MKHLLTLLAALLLSAPLHAQTIKSLGYNTTNGNIVAATNVVWTNSFSFSTNTVSAQVRTNLNLGWSALTNSNSATSLLGYTTNGQVVANTGTNVLTFTNLVSAQALTVAIGTNQYIYADDSIAEFFVPIAMGSSQGISFTTNAAATTRTNLGLGWSALTNSNAATFRTAAGLGQTDTVTLQKLMLNGTTSSVFPLAIGERRSQGTNSLFYGFSWDGAYNGDMTYHHDASSINSSPIIRANATQITLGANVTFANTSHSAQTRTNLGLPLAALTNTSNVTMMRALSGSTNTNHPYSGSISVVGTNNTNTLVFSNGILQSVQ